MRISAAAHDANEIRVSRGLGDGTFETPLVLRGGDPRQRAAVDVNGDGAQDLCVFGGTVCVLPNRGTDTLGCAESACR